MKYALVVGALVACRKSRHDKVAVVPPPVAFDEVAVDLPPGMSDLSLDDHEHLWAIAERDRVVAEIVLTDNPLAAAVTLHPLDGVRDGLDTESLAWLGGGKFAGTEGQDAATASVMFGELRPDGHIALAQTVPLTNDQLGVELTVNHGAEGMCGHGDDLIVAIETFGTYPNGSRWTPLVRMQAGMVTGVQKLLLTTDGGKPCSARSRPTAPPTASRSSATTACRGSSRSRRRRVPPRSRRRSRSSCGRWCAIATTRGSTSRASCS